MKTLLLIAAFTTSLYLGLGSSSPGSIPSPDAHIVFANPSYNKVMPVVGTGAREYDRQVVERLEYLEAALQSRDVSDWQEDLQAERARNIERLREYRLAGNFPINYDHPETQLPCFYDRDGNLCAVAHLVAESEGMPLVREIKSRYQYATVQQMDMPELEEWIAESGLTREEVITIQEPGWFGGSEIDPIPTITAFPEGVTPADTVNQREASEQIEPIEVQTPDLSSVEVPITERNVGQAE